MFTVLSVLVLAASASASASWSFDGFEKDFNNKSLFSVTYIKDDQLKSSLESRQVSQLLEQKWYIGGRRQNGDYLRLKIYDNINYDGPTDSVIRVEVQPQQSFYFTHLSVLVEQSSSTGRCYTTEGGVGKDYMTLFIESRQTSYVNFQVFIYGRNYQ